MKLLAALSATSLLIACQAYAEVKLVREYLLKPPRDRRALFAMTITPEQDVLSLVGNDNGTWRLSRVRRWFDRGPVEEALTIPGLFKVGREGWSNWRIWSVELQMTNDGKFVICVVSAYPRTGGSREDVITVVDLTQFKTIASSHPSSTGQVSGDYRTYDLIGARHLIANANTSFPRHPGDDAFFGGALHKLAVFSLPDLDITDRCEYSEWVRSGKPVRRENENSCAILLAKLGVGSLDELYRPQLERTSAVVASEKARPSDCALLTYATVVSHDGRFRWERCTGGHKSFWGNFVVSHPVESIFLTETGQKLGSIKVPSDHALHSSFATTEGRDYLLVMEGGTRLSVYELIH